MRTGILLLFLTVLTACVQSPVRPLESVNQHTNSQTTLVAFSIISKDPFALRKIELVASTSSSERWKAKLIDVSPGDSGSYLFLYEIPIQGMQFGKLQFKSGRSWWRTTSPGVAVIGEPGAITYVGRIQLNAVRFGQYANSDKSYPATVNIVVTDSSVVDLPRLATRFNVPEGMPIRTMIPNRWGTADFIELLPIAKPNRRDHNHGMEPVWADQEDKMPGG